MIVSKYYKVIRVIKDGGDGVTPFYIENISGEDGQFVTGSTNSTHVKRNLMYKVDDGEWFEYTDDGTMKIDVPNGSRIYLKGDNPLGSSSNSYYSFKLLKKNSSSWIKNNVGGYLTSLIRSTNFDEVDTIPDYAFGTLPSGVDSVLNLITSNIKYIGAGAFKEFLRGAPVSSLPEGMFANVTTVGGYAFNYCFYGNSKLTTLPEGMFANVTTVGGYAFQNCFANNKSITSLPEGMFSNVTTVGSNGLQLCFDSCTSLTALPEGMFSNVTSSDSQSFDKTFQNCTSLTTLPEGMFSNLINISSNYSFQHCFKNCTSLTALPKGMFSNLPTLSGGSIFNECFVDCTSLTTISEGMFSNVTTVGNYSLSNCFKNCTSLTTIPEGMFANVTTVSGGAFNKCFIGCTSLLIGPNFKKITGSTSHDAFDECFKDCTSLQLIYAPQMSAWNESYFQNWVSGVYPTGKMYVKSGVVPPTGTSGVPEGWQLLNY